MVIFMLRGVFVFCGVFLIISGFLSMVDGEWVNGLAQIMVSFVAWLFALGLGFQMPKEWRL